MKLDMGNYHFLENIPKITWRGFLTSSVSLGDCYIIEVRVYPDGRVYTQVVEKYKAIYKFNDDEFKLRHFPLGPAHGFMN